MKMAESALSQLRERFYSRRGPQFDYSLLTEQQQEFLFSPEICEHKSPTGRKLRNVSLADIEPDGERVVPLLWDVYYTTLSNEMRTVREYVEERFPSYAGHKLVKMHEKIGKSVYLFILGDDSKIKVDFDTVWNPEDEHSMGIGPPTRFSCL